MYAIHPYRHRERGRAILDRHQLPDQNQVSRHHPPRRRSDRLRAGIRTGWVRLVEDRTHRVTLQILSRAGHTRDVLSRL